MTSDKAQNENPLKVNSSGIIGRIENPAPMEGNVPPSTGKGEAIANHYTNIAQGTPIHGLISSSASRGNMVVDAVTHVGRMLSDGVIIIFDAEAINDITPQTFKTLILLLKKLTVQLPHTDNATADTINKARAVVLTPAEYAKACKIKDIKDARAQLNASARALYAVSLEWDEDVYEVPEGKSRRVKTTRHHRMRITDHTITQDEGNPVKNGVLEFRFSFDMAEYLSNSYIMPYANELLHINTHYYPYAIAMGWKLCTLYNLNFGMKTQNTTTVKTLLNAAKGIPDYNDLSQAKQVYERIIKPFDKNLSALVEAGVLSEYWYIDNNEKRIESVQLGSLKYSEFTTLKIHYRLKDYPDQTPRLEAKSKRIKAAISRRKNASNKNINENGAGA